MATKSIAWTTGTGNITLTYTGQGNDSVTVTSDPNPLYYERSQTLTFATLGSSIEVEVTVRQTMREPNFVTSAGDWCVTSDDKFLIVQES